MYLCISKVILKKLLIGIHKSPFVGIGLDESTDRAKESHVVIIVRFILNAEVTTTFLKVATIENGKAITIYNTVLAVLRGYNIPVRKVSCRFSVWYYQSYNKY